MRYVFRASLLLTVRTVPPTEYGTGYGMLLYTLYTLLRSDHVSSLQTVSGAQTADERQTSGRRAETGVGQGVRRPLLRRPHVGMVEPMSDDIESGRASSR